MTDCLRDELFDLLSAESSSIYIACICVVQFIYRTSLKLGAAYHEFLTSVSWYFNNVRYESKRVRCPEPIDVISYA